MMVKTVVTDDEDKIDTTPQQEVPFKCIKIEKYEKDQIETENRFNILSDDKDSKHDNSNIVHDISKYSYEPGYDTPDKKTVKEMVADLTQIWKKQRTGSEFSTTTKCM